MPRKLYYGIVTKSLIKNLSILRFKWNSFPKLVNEFNDLIIQHQIR
jgi:hypothetical protein